MKHIAKVLALALSVPGLQGMGAVTGTLDCTINDANLDFHFNAYFDFAGNRPLFRIGGDLKSKNPKTYGPLRQFPITGETLLQQWFYGDQLNLELYAERRRDDAPFASMSLAILTRQAPGDEQNYVGEYTLTIENPAADSGAGDDPVDVSGKVSCQSH